MNKRKFGKINWHINEVGYGMWGMAGWSNSDDTQSIKSINKAIELGCNFFDTAWAYGAGKSEQILGKILKQHPDKDLHFGTKIPLRIIIKTPALKISEPCLGRPAQFF